MKKTILAVSALAAAAVLSGCARGSVTEAGAGTLFSGDTKHFVAVTDNVGSKEGTAGPLVNIIGIVPSGDTSVSTAAKNGGIKKIAVDSKIKNILGIYSETTIIVTGE